MVSNGDSTPRGEHAFDLLVTNASAVLGGVRNEQYTVADDTAIGVVGQRLSFIGPGVRARRADRPDDDRRHAGCSPSPA